MARSISEQELQLKKRARRRLVGAVVLVSAVAVVLPMVLDSEPKPVRQNVDIHIPSPEAGEFKPKTSEAPQQPVAPIKGLPEAPPSDTAPAASPSTPSAQASAQVRMDTAPKPEAPAAKGSGATDRDTSSTAKDRTESARPSTPPPKVEATAPRQPPSSERAESTRSASAAPASKPEVAARAASGSDSTASARSTSASPKRASEAEADSGNYVVQVAALADAAKARQLQKQMSGAGLKTYTEVVSTKTGEITRVRAGPYATREAAEKARAQLKKAGLDGQVVAK